MGRRALSSNFSLGWASGITERISLYRVFRQLFKHFLKYVDNRGRTLGSGFFEHR